MYRIPTIEAPFVFADNRQYYIHRISLLFSIGNISVFESNNQSSRQEIRFTPCLSHSVHVGSHKTRNLWKKSQMYRKFAVKIVFIQVKQGNDIFANNNCLKFKLCTPRRQHEITCSTYLQVITSVYCKQWKTWDKYSWSIELRSN